MRCSISGLDSARRRQGDATSLRDLINGWTMEEINDRMEDIIAFSELGEFIDLLCK